MIETNEEQAGNASGSTEDNKPTSGVTSFQAHHVGDNESTDDALGFKPYVNAVASFLVNDATNLPITISIEGEWGSGKSSFMRQIQNVIKEKDEKALFVGFNAWRHDKDEAIWASFALEFIRKIEGQLTLWEKFEGRIKTYFARLKWEQVAKPIFKITLLVGISWVIVRYVGAPTILDALLTETKDIENVSKILGIFGFWGGRAGFLAACWFLLKLLRDPYNAIFSHDLSQYIERPDYESKRTFIARFHEDFKVILKYGIPVKRKAFVFVDDLDRSDALRMADFMQAFKLMLPEEGRIAFIIGMDRKKVALGIAAKHSAHLKYLDEGRSENEIGAALRYGFAFIEKFINISFEIPSPSPEERKGYIRHILGKSTRVEDQSHFWRRWSGKMGIKRFDTASKANTTGNSTNSAKGGNSDEQLNEKRETFALRLGNESEMIHEIVEITSVR